MAEAEVIGASAVLGAQQEAELGRYASEFTRADLKDQQRIYDYAKEKVWDHKYHFFSDMHMRAAYRVFARARHDPLNKDPCWGKAVLENVNNNYEETGRELAEIFHGNDITGDGSLTRPELKRALHKAMPSLSDQELTVIFDTFDQDRSGAITMNEFSSTLELGRMAVRNGEDEGGEDCGGSSSSQRAGKWRNPVHHFKRLPPARVEGWDHLDPSPSCKPPLPYPKLCELEAEKVISRLSQELLRTPTALRHQHQGGKHDYFTGGGDAVRFHRHARTQEEVAGRSSPRPPTCGSSSRKPSAEPASRLPDVMWRPESRQRMTTPRLTTPRQPCRAEGKRATTPRCGIQIIGCCPESQQRLVTPRQVRLAATPRKSERTGS